MSQRETPMSDYRRWIVDGGTYFFTVVTYRRRRLFANQAARKLLGDVMRSVAAERPFQTVAIVVLPDHLHTIWTLPLRDHDYSGRWKRIKNRFTREWLGLGGREAQVAASQSRRGHRGICQRRFWEHMVRDETDLENNA